MRRRGCGDARQEEGLFWSGSVIMDYFAFKYVAVNLGECKACAVAEAVSDTHVAQENVHCPYLEVKTVRWHARW